MWVVGGGWLNIAWDWWAPLAWLVFSIPFDSEWLGRESNLSPLQLEYDFVLSTTGEVVDSKPRDADGCQCDLVLIRFCVPRDTNCQWQLASSKKFAESSYLFLSLCFTFVVMLFLVVCYLISRYKCTDCCYNEFRGFWPVYLLSFEVLPCITDYHHWQHSYKFATHVQVDS